jgi:PAS domain S-box-containing protein
MQMTKICEVFDRSAIALSLVDLQAADQPLVLISPAFSELTGYGASEALGRNCRFLGRPGENLTSRAELRHALSLGQEVQVVLRNYRRDGSAFHNLLLLHPLDNQGPGARYMLGSQFLLAQPVDMLTQAERHLSRFLTALDEMSERAERLVMTRRRQMADATAQVLRGWLRDL